MLSFLIEYDACSYLIPKFIVMPEYQLKHYATVSIKKTCNVC